MKPNIETHIPPPRFPRQRRGAMAIIRSLRPGESMWFEGYTPHHMAQVLYRIRQKKERLSAEWATRTEGRGTRIWCLSDPMA